MEDMDALAKARFGGLKPKQRLIVKEKKCFDSADWALAKEGKKQPDSIPTAPVGAVPEVQHHPKPAGSNLKPSK